MQEAILYKVGICVVISKIFAQDMTGINRTIKIIPADTLASWLWIRKNAAW